MKIRTRFIIALLLTLFMVPFGNQLIAQQFYTTVAVSTVASATTATQQLIAPVAGKAITVYRAGLVIGTGGATGSTVTFFSCTAANCTINFAGLTAISESVSATGFTQLGPLSPTLALPVGAGLFVANTAAAPYTASVTATQQ